LPHRLFGAALQLVRWDILFLFVGRNVPEVAEGVLEAAQTVAVELVLDRPNFLSAGRHGALRHDVHVLDIKMQADRRAPIAFGLRCARTRKTHPPA
jgi:hypothetical protein